jgi:glycosyltransferase involved in cell wall biosynthesis
MSKVQTLKVAIVHDWLIGGGAEQVVEQLHGMFPNAPIYTSYISPQWRQRMSGATFKTGFLQYFPSIRKFIPFLRIWWFSSLDFSAYDLVISSSGAEAKGIKTKPKKVATPPSTNSHLQTPKHPLHVNYCHAPTHYYWSRYDTYLQDPGFGALNWLARLGLRTLVGPLRKWDHKAAQRPDYIIANSSHTQTQIKEYYGRESIVIHPPVDTEFFTLPSSATPPSTNSHLQTSTKPRSGYVITGRHVPYKRVDLAVEVCTELGLPLTVVGDGPELQNLKAIAGPTIKFCGKVPRAQVREILQSSKAFIFPGLDDFGIAPVEALAAGTPIIAYEGGGALDYIVPGKTGEFFFPQTAEALKHQLQSFDSKKYSASDISTYSTTFSQKEFADKLQRYIQELID